MSSVTGCAADDERVVAGDGIPEVTVQNAGVIQDGRQEHRQSGIKFSSVNSMGRGQRSRSGRSSSITHNLRLPINV